MKPKSTHVSDPFLQPFLQPSFDPAEYLNSTLPSLAVSSQPSTAKSSSAPAASLSDLSSQTQSLLSQLNAQTSRLTSILTQLTEDILRSGGRLAYEVEVLRGEASGLSETLNEGTKDDVALFWSTDSPENSTAETQDGNPAVAGPTHIAEQPLGSLKEPAYINQLRTFTHVRQRLDSVVKVFGEAMQWSLPPSEVSLTSSFISVSAPEPGADSSRREEKGREFAESIRTEITDLIVSAENRAEGYEAALEQIGALKDLAQVWKGTAEEKARVRFVEGLAKLAEDRLRELEREARTASPRRGAVGRRPAQTQKGAGFLDNLHRMRMSLE